MATKEELSDQLALTQKLAATVDQMAKAMARIDSSYDTQIASVEKLTKAIETLTSQDFSKLNANKLDAARKELKDTEQSVTSLSGRIKDLGQNLNKKFPAAAVVGAAALSGVVQGVRNVIALGKGITGFFTSFVSGAGSIAAAIIAIPFKMFNALVDTAAAAAGGMNELLVAIEKVRKEFGDLRGPASHAILDTTKTLKGFSDTGLSAFRIFGTMAERLEHVTKIASSMGATFGAVRKEFEENGGALLAFEKGLDGSSEGMKQLAERAIAMGKPITKVFIDMTKQTLALGKAFDIDQKLIGKDMVKALADVKHFGQLTVKEIGVAAVYSRKLGIELDKITGTLDAFETFDTAAENASKLSQSFGVTVDAFKLMDAQNPADQLDMLRKSLKATGQSTETMTRQQLKLLAQTSGLDEATAKLAFSSKNEGVSLDDIKKKSAEAEKKTLSQAEAMGKLADSIERLVKSGGGQEGGYWQQFFKGFLGGVQSSKEFREIIWNIKRGLQQTYFEGVRLGRAFVQMFPGVKDFLGGIADFFKPAKFKKLTSGVTDVIEEWMKGLTDPNGKASFGSLMTNIQKKFFDFFDTSSPSGQRTLAGFKTMTKTMAKILSEGIKWISDKMADGIRFVVDLLSGKVSLSSIGAKTEGGIGFLGEVLAPIAEGLEHAWTVLKDPLFSLIKTLFKKLKGFLMSDEVLSIIKPAVWPMAAVLFGPMFSRAIAGFVTQSLGKIAFKSIAAAFSKKAGVAAVEKAGASGLSKLGAATGIGAIVVAGAAIGKGVSTYTEKITSTMDHSSKVIAAGATGLIDALTLGLLPDDLMSDLANTFGQVADQITLAMTEVFGAGFVTSVKRKLSGTFELFGNIYDFFATLFTGNQADVTRSATELGLSVLRFLQDALEFTFIQLPIFLAKLSTKVLDIALSALSKVIFTTLGLLTKGIDAALGTDFSAKINETLNKASDTVKKGIDETNKTIQVSLEYAASSVSNASKEAQDKYLRTAEDQAKIAEQATKSIGESQAASVAAANKNIERSLNEQVGDIDVSQTASHIEEYTKSMKKISESVDTKGIQQTLDSVSEMTKKTQELNASLAQASVALKDISNISVDSTALARLGDNFSNTIVSMKDPVRKVVSSLDDAALNGVDAARNRIEKYARSLDKINDTVTSNGIGQALSAVGEMIKRTQELDSALAQAPNMNVDARLRKLANATGVGGKFAYTVKSKDIVINLNLNVTMDVGEAEKIMIMRKTSIIRDRLEFATGAGTHGDQATPSIPENYTPGWNVSPTKV